MLRKKCRWPVIAGVIGAFIIVGIAGNIFIMSQYTQGTIELPAELPSPEMMAHIAAHLDQFIEPNGPFTRSMGFGIVTALDYANESGLTITINLRSGASPEEFLAAEPKWQGQYLGYSDLLAALSGSGKYTLMFSCSHGPLVLFITQEDAAAISTTPAVF